VNYIHSCKVIHRDLKSQNILICKELNVKIADFGLARTYSNEVRPYSEEVVTLWYRPPEILLGRTEYTSAVDIWSVGCIFYELLTKIPLFMGTNEVDQLRKIFEIMGVPSDMDLPEIKDKHFDFPPQSPENPVKTFKDLVDAANFDENERDLLMKMLIYNPSKRITAKAALSHPYFDDLL
jgi:serine/threonine protein kinase